MDPQLFEDLFSEPYGPYLDSEALAATCKSVPSKFLGLTNFMMECGQKPIGLNHSEPNQPEYQAARIKKYHDVRFRGVLTIETLDWLQPLAKKRINEDIRLRHVAVYSKEGRRFPRESDTPSIESLYRRVRLDRRVKIVIQGTKNLPAMYLMLRDLKNGLVIQSLDQFRKYQVLSMDAVTYAESRTYLGRYRTLSILERIVSDDNDHRKRSHKTERPRHERTPEWFAKMYKKQLASPAMARQRRIVWTSEDTDVEEGTEGKMKYGREHVLRHVSTAEVRSLLATHAEWILDDQQKRQKKFLDLDVWKDWVRTSRKWRKDAWKAGVRWGWLDDKDPIGPLESDEDDDMVLEEQEPVRSRAKRKPKPKAQPRQNRPSASGSRVSARVEQPLFYPEEDEDLPHGNVYDPDFSPPSSPAASDWDADESLPSRSASPVDPEIASLIPVALYYAPMLPDSSLVWRCPVRDCEYRLRLLELGNEHFSHLPVKHIQAFKRGGWKLSEQWVQSAFMQLVSKHYEDHLDKLGVVLHKNGNQTQLGWKNPKHHPPLRARNHRPIFRPDSDEDVKMELEA